MARFELEQELPRTTVASYLRELADGLAKGDKVTFVAGEESATVSPAESIHMNLMTDDDDSWLGGDKGRRLVLELGWEHQESDIDDGLSIVLQGTESTEYDDHQQSTPPR